MYESLINKLNKIKFDSRCDWKEIADKCNVSASTLSKFVKNENKSLEVKTLENILKFIGTDLEQAIKDQIEGYSFEHQLNNIGHYADSGQVFPLNHGDIKSYQCNVYWKGYKCLTCKAQPFSNWYVAFKDNIDNDMKSSDFYNCFSVVYQNDDKTFIGVGTKKNDNFSYIGSVTGQPIEVTKNIEEIKHIFPIDVIFSPLA